MNKSNILAYAEEIHTKTVIALLDNKDASGQTFKNSEKRYAWVAGMQAALIEKLVDHIKE